MPDLLSIAEELYGLLPAEFTDARNARAKQLRGEDRALADQVEESLRAAMTDPGAAAALRTGLLVKPLTSTGLGDLDPASLVAVPEAVGAAGPPGRAGLSVVGGKPKKAAGKAKQKRAAARQKTDVIRSK